MQVCLNCRASFEITQEDQTFYARIQVPEPTFCPTCRLQRRLTFRNERNLYKRSCDLCHKITVSLFDVDAPFPVYCRACWWSDQWDPASFGRDFDFNRPFFDQFKELLNAVPKAAVFQFANENSEFNSLLAYSKNSYMSPGSYFIEDSLYVRKSQYSKDCLIGNFLDHCELVAYSTNCRNCYRSHHLIDCRNCSHSAYLAHCSNCQDCFMCSDLNGTSFHFKNKPCNEADYRKIIAEYASKDPKEVLKEFKDFVQSLPKRAQNQLNCEQCSGDYIYNSKNAIDCYDCFDVENSKNLIECVAVKNSMDLSMHDKEIEWCYELCAGGESNFNTRFSFCPGACPNSDYLYGCFYLSDSFGCDGMHSRQKYFILNKAYSAEEYTKMRAKIIEHIKKTAEWGEFFPIPLSPFAYNETVAQDYFPLSKEQALTKGYRWKDESLKSSDAVQDALICEQCDKPYKIIPQEAALAQKLIVPLSRLCTNCRYFELLAFKNPRQLWERNCDKCQKQITSTYSLKRLETVYCDVCYLAQVY